MTHTCTHCNQTFESHSKKANHIRWKHVLPGFTSKGYESIRANVRETNRKRSEKAGELVIEERMCKCGQTFKATFRPKAKWKGRITCSDKCGKSRVHSDESRKKNSESVKLWIREHPEEFTLNQAKSNESPKNLRRSSKSERALAELLKPEGFTRARVIRTPDLNFAVDITSPCGKIWIESDGPYHFEKVHKNHDFDKTRRRDEFQEKEALERDVLLIRVNNGKFSLEEQVEFIRDSISAWDQTGAVKRLY